MTTLGMPARAPKVHQFIGQRITQNIYEQINLEDLIPVHEANCIDDDPTSLAPDVTVFSLPDEVPVVAFQVCHKAGIKKELKNLETLFNYGLQEVFLFVYNGTITDYEITEIHKYTPAGEDTENNEYSDALGIDIDDDLAAP